MIGCKFFLFKRQTRSQKNRLSIKINPPFLKVELVDFLLTIIHIKSLYRLLFQNSPIKIGLNEIYNGIIPERLDYNILINGIIAEKNINWL